MIGGALLGGLIGNLLDQRDKEMQAKAASQAFESSPSGKTVAWSNPDSGHAGTVTPTRTYQTAYVKGLAPEEFKAADRRGDGKLDLDEFLNARFVLFELADTDDDGVLTLDEIEVYIKRLR